MDLQTPLHTQEMPGGLSAAAAIGQPNGPSARNWSDECGASMNRVLESGKINLHADLKDLQDIQLSVRSKVQQSLRRELTCQDRHVDVALRFKPASLRAPERLRRLPSSRTIRTSSATGGEEGNAHTLVFGKDAPKLNVLPWGSMGARVPPGSRSFNF